MKNCLMFLCALFSFVFVLTDSSFATNWDWGTNITIYDGSQNTSHGSGWYSGVNRGTEDQEVEPGNEIDQPWDLEGFFLNGSNLTMVGGYDFVAGEYMSDAHTHIASGDIFIDVDGSYTQQDTPMTTGNYGYEYVLDMDFSDSGVSYTVYDIRSSNDISLLNVSVPHNMFSNPWRYVSGGTQVGALYTADYQTGITDFESGFLGEGAYSVWNPTSSAYENVAFAHNAVGVDLSFLTPEQRANFTAHFTMECGNDNLMGAVPEPATILLFGIGLLGLSGVGRKRN